MLLKRIGLIFFTLLACNAYSQQLVRATNVQLVTTPGTKVVVTGGGMSFTGTSNWKSNGDSIYLVKTTATANEGWLDSTTTGVLDPTSTGHVFLRGSFLQSFYGLTKFYDLSIRNTVGDTLLSSCEVRNMLHLDTGFVFTETGYGNDSLLVSNPVTTAIVSTSSFTKSWVNGRLSRSGNVTTPFYLFPIGKTDSLYAPIKLLKGNTNTATWTAEYFFAAPYDRLNIFVPPLDHISGVEYWEISSNNQISTDDDARLSLSWRGQSRVSANAVTRDSLLVAQYIDRPPFKWDVPGGWTPPGNTVGFDSLSGYVTSFAPTNNYSFAERRFTLGTISKYNLLPIKLIYFTAMADGSRVRLNWEVANEQDTRVYEVQRSLDANHFAVLSTVNSRQLSHSAYTDYDPSPVMGWNYYRLKIIDKSGNYFYSPVRPVKFEKGIEQVKIFPNPATDILHVQMPSSWVNTVTLQLYGIDGKFISRNKPSQGNLVLNVRNLAGGTYILQIIKANGEAESHTFIKQ